MAEEFIFPRLTRSHSDTTASCPVSSIFLLILLCLPFRALASELIQVGEARFAREYPVDTVTLPVMGTGILKFGGLIDVYAAALYHPADINQANLLDPLVPKRLELEYFVGLDREKFIESAETVLEKQHGPSELARLQGPLDELHNKLVDVSSGDRYSITHIPGEGLRLEHNRKITAFIPDVQLSTAYFGIWLGDPPISPALKKDLVKK